MINNKRTGILILLTFLLGSDLIGQMNPQYIAQVGGKNSGPIKRGQFQAQEGIEGLIRINDSHWEPIQVDSFYLAIIRDTSVIVNHHNIGNRFDTYLISELQQLRVNDRILIFSIYAHGNLKTKVFLSPLEYRIE